MVYLLVLYVKILEVMLFFNSVNNPTKDSMNLYVRYNNKKEIHRLTIRYKESE